MKKLYALIGLLLVCTLNMMAQPRLTSNTQEHNFGQIQWKQPVSVTYTITNTGNEPLVMSNVTASCDCSTVDWTLEPIAPGEKGFVTATFDANLLGHFEKTVAIYSNSDPHLVYLSFRGEVVMEVTDYTRTHPYEIGQLRVDKKELFFKDMHRGEKQVMELSVVNLTERPYEPVLMHLPPCVTVEAKPQVILKGKRGVLRLTVDADKLTDYGETRAPLYLARFTGDKVSKSNCMPFSVVLLPSFKGMTEQEKQNAPHVQVSDETVDFTAVMKNKNKASHSVVLTNTGKTPLIIDRLQTDNTSFRVYLPKTVLAPGESVKLKVSAFKKGNRNKSREMNILMITNDPEHPKVMIHVKR